MIIYILIWSASAYLIFEIAQWLNLAQWHNHVLKTKPHHCMSGLCQHLYANGTMCTLFELLNPVGIVSNCQDLNTWAYIMLCNVIWLCQPEYSWSPRRCEQLFQIIVHPGVNLSVVFYNMCGHSALGQLLVIYFINLTTW